MNTHLQQQLLHVVGCNDLQTALLCQGATNARRTRVKLEPEGPVTNQHRRAGTACGIRVSILAQGVSSRQPPLQQPAIAPQPLEARQALWWLLSSSCRVTASQKPSFTSTALHAPVAGASFAALWAGMHAASSATAGLRRASKLMAASIWARRGC